MQTNLLTTLRIKSTNDLVINLEKFPIKRMNISNYSVFINSMKSYPLHVFDITNTFFSPLNWK